jgi:autophagy-related protein 2
MFVELAEIFSIDLKLDYKPRRVDYRALREGRTIELMNFFHFDGAEMTLRHITLAGVGPAIFISVSLLTAATGYRMA